jgi:hypothetical protein
MVSIVGISVALSMKPPGVKLVSGAPQQQVSGARGAPETSITLLCQCAGR